MNAGRFTRAARLALFAGLAALTSSWVVERYGGRDGALFGGGGAPLDLAIAASGDRLFVAAADDRALWVLDPASGRRLARQAMNDAPTGLVGGEAPYLPLVLFTQLPDVCELHPFRERTLASCFRPGDADVGDVPGPMPLVLGAVRDVDGSVVYALGRLTAAEPAVELRRYAFQPTRRRWESPQQSRWLPVPRNFAYTERWPMSVDAETRQVVLALPGTSEAWVFGDQLAFQRSVAIGADPRDVAIVAQTHAALVADATLGQVWKIALDSGEVLGKVDVGAGARSIALDSRRRVAWIASSFGDAIVALDIASLRTVVRLPVREGAHALALDAVANRLIVANARYGSVAAFALGEPAAAIDLGGGSAGVPRMLWEASR